MKQGLSPRERRWAILAHGLGHALLHSEPCNQVWLYVSDRSTDKEEQEAEAFAYDLLIDRRRVLHSGMDENLEMATYYAVPATKMRSQLGGFE